MEPVHFFALTDKMELLKFFEGDFSDLSLLSTEDFEVDSDSQKHPTLRYFIEIEVKEIAETDYRKFRALKYLLKKIVVFPRYQLYDGEIINGVLHSSVTISPFKKRDITGIKNKRKNFIMAEVRMCPSEGTIKFIQKWENILESTQLALYTDQIVSSNKVLIEKLTPIIEFGSGNKIFNQNFIQRYFLVKEWRQIIDENLPVCHARMFRLEEIENNIPLKESCVGAKIQKIIDQKQKILRA